MATHRLEPRVSFGQYSALFGDLSLEHGGLRANRCERSKSIGNDAGGRTQLALCIVRKDRDESCVLVIFG